MQSEVELHPPIDYPSWVPVTGFSLLGASIAAMVVLRVILPGRLRSRKGRKKPLSQPTEVTLPANVAEAKWRYASQLDALRGAYDRGEVDTRVAYEEISRVARSFAHEATGIDVREYTLEDLRRSPWPALADLISVCYEPEFAEHSLADPRVGIEHAKAVIWSWR